MSKSTTTLTDLPKEFESGGPEKKIVEDPEVNDEGEEGDESDDYEEIDDEVCVQGNITKDFEIQSIYDRRKDLDR